MMNTEQPGPARVLGYHAALCLFCFSLPFPFIISSVMMGVLGFFWLLAGVRPAIRQLCGRKLILLWVLFYLLHVAGYFISTDKAQASFELVHKMSFAVLPLIAGTGPELKERHIRGVFLSFTAGIVVIACWAFVRACYEYAGDGDLQHFFYHDLAGVTEPNAVYLAWYTLCALFFLILIPYDFFKTKRWFYFLLLVFLEVFFLLLSSRLLIALHTILLVPMVLLANRSRKNWLKPLLLISLVFTGVIMVVAVTDNPVSERYKAVFPSGDNVWLKDPELQEGKQQFTNLTLRLFLWKTSLEAIRDHRLYYYGGGIGDVERYQKASIQRYDAMLNEGNRQAELWKYNVHNMYIESLYMLGAPGLLNLLLLIFLPVWVFRDRALRYPFLAFTLVSAIFMCVEAVLQTQAGIIFFPLFSILFLRFHYDKGSAQRNAAAL